MSQHAPATIKPRRRSLLGAFAASPWLHPLSLLSAFGLPARAAEEPQGAEPPRLALVIGNREYPNGQDLPPIYKNVNDLSAVLEQRGFQVTKGLDLDLNQARSLMDSFAASVRAAPPDSTVFFYFSGHGAQVDSENLLVSAHINPQARPDTLIKGSMTLINDVIDRLPKRPQALTIAVVDACRTSLKSALEADGLNQVEAPPGCLIAFATGAGKPAIAPADDKRNTFYTASLVKLMASESGEITFSDLFRLVKSDVQTTMLNYPIKLLRQFAQFPFIAENVQVRRRLAPRVAVTAAAAAPPPRFKDSDEAGDWQRLEAALWPADVARMADDYLKHYPDSRVAGSAQVARDGALDAAKILRRNDVRLYRSAFQLASGAAPVLQADLAKAARGDKDAAARLGRWYRDNSTSSGSGSGYGGYGASPAVDSGRYEGWMQYAAALGNGIASYDLALYYRRVEQPLLASQYEARARELGYTPPPSLDNSRK